MTRIIMYYSMKLKVASGRPDDYLLSLSAFDRFLCKWTSTILWKQCGNFRWRPVHSGVLKRSHTFGNRNWISDFWVEEANHNNTQTFFTIMITFLLCKIILSSFYTYCWLMNKGHFCISSSPKWSIDHPFRCESISSLYCTWWLLLPW